MIKLTIILFREFLEIALIINLVLSITKEFVGSKKYVFLGIFIAGLLSIVLGTLAEQLGSLADGVGEELLTIVILLSASAMILLSLIWIKKINVKKNILHLASSSLDNKKLNFMICLIVASALLREGTEIILFSVGVVASTMINKSEYIVSLAIGAFSGLTCGFLIFRILSTMLKKYIFTITNIMLLILASILASEAAKIMVSAGMVSILSEPAWNLTHILPESNKLGYIMNFVLGYSDSPFKLQLLFYMAPIVIFLILEIYAIIARKKS